ncbi:MAG TPA: MFS transporter [Ardenticatenaceae bacterium]|nr:MFS transporter [Ardenticatenaceae bacterium]
MMWTTYNEYVPEFLQSFGLSALVVTAVLTADNALGFFLEPAAGLLSDRTRSRFGRRLPWILIGVPVAATCLALIPIPVIFLAGRGGVIGAQTGGLLSPLALFIAGMLLAMAVFRTPTVAMMPDLVESPQRSLANGLLQMLSGAGTLSALVFGAWLAARYGPAGAFWLASTVMILCAVLLWALVGSPASATAARSITYTPRMWREIVLLLGAIAAGWLGFIFVDRSLPGFLARGWGLSELQAEGYRRFLLLVIAVAAIPAGAVADHVGRQRSLLLGAGLMVVALGAAALAAPPLPVTTLLIGLAGLGWASMTVNSLPMLLDLGPEGRLGTSTGLYYLAFAAAGLTAPWLTRATSPDARAAIWLGVGFLVVALVAVAAMRTGAGEVELSPG